MFCNLGAHNVARIGISLGLLATPLPFWAQVLAMLFVDLLDCFPGIGPLFAPNPTYCQTPAYQRNDKITDTIVYAIYFLAALAYFPQWLTLLLFLLLLFRFIGVVEFLKSTDRKYLAKFPDFYGWSLLVIALWLEYGRGNSQTLAWGLIGAAVIKIVQEILQHGMK